jgi:hypothetical protein
VGVRERPAQNRSCGCRTADLDDEEMVLNAALAGLGLAFLVEEQVTPLLKPAY